MLSLRYRLLKDFHIKDSFTASEVYKWYLLHKRNPSVLPPTGEIYKLIINPLLHEKLIIRIDRGIYLLVKHKEDLQPQLEVIEEDEFDRYIKSKVI